MAVKIRLMRVGKKKQPTYRVVVADGRSPRDGRYIEIIGHYGPRPEPSHVAIDGERALAWLRRGAQPTEPVEKLLRDAGVWERYQAEGGRPPRSWTRTERPGQPGQPKASEKARAGAAADAPGEVPAADGSAAAMEGDSE